jgi:Glycosyltransferase
MRIGVDACCWSNKRGFGRFTRELLSALVAIDQKNEYFFFVDNETASNNEFPHEMNIVVASTSVIPTQAASASGRRSIRDLGALSRQVKKHDLDLFFFPAVYSYFPIFNRAKVIVTIHDAIANHYPDLVFPNKKLKLFWKLKEYLALRQAHLILTVSEYSKREIIKYFNIPESRMRVIPEAPNTAFTVLARNEEMTQILRRYKLDLGERFLLYVGGISPHKNLKALVDAYHQLTTDSTFADVKLVLVGDYKGDSFHSDYPSLKLYIEQLRLGEKVIFTGFIEDKELAYFYNAASFLVLPSFEEGFGLPAIEAMACGTPVISSDRGSLPEILGGAGRFFDPYRPETLLNALQNALSNDSLREEMRQYGLIRVKQFTWEKAARESMSIFTALAGK